MILKNWKSTVAFFAFVAVYIYSIFEDKPSPIIEISGYIALYSSILMMFRSDFTSELLGKIVDTMKKS